MITQNARDAAQQASQSAEQGAVQAQQAAEQARATAADARANADAARDIATSQEGNPTLVTTNDGPGGSTRVFSVPDGRGGTTLITIGPEGVRVGDVTASTAPARESRDVPPGVLEIVKDVSFAAVVIVLGIPMVRAFARWLDRRTAAPVVSAPVLQRLDRIEQAVETVAVEMERMGEGQRFAAKLLAERAQAPAGDFVAAADRATVPRA